MTRYDFTTQPNRLDQNTMKWHEAESNPELLYQQRVVTLKRGGILLGQVV